MHMQLLAPVVPFVVELPSQLVQVRFVLFDHPERYVLAEQAVQAVAVALPEMNPAGQPHEV
jgi:hypothetical protein